MAMDSETALDRLAILAGVMPSFEDVFGTPRDAPESTLRTILGTLGFDAPDEAAAATCATRLAERTWREELEPVYVIDEGTPATIAVAHARSERDESRTWDIVREDGTASTGRFTFADLPQIERRDIDGVAYERRALALGAPLPAGYHRFVLRSSRGERATTIVVAPATCWLPGALETRGVWGLAVQVYALRSERNWGIGDFTDLARLCETVRNAGGAAIGLNPLHELRYAPGGVPSPYSPTSRTTLNWIYLDVEALPGFDEADVDRADVAASRGNEHVDYDAVAVLKRNAARAAYDRFSASEAGEDASAFDAFVAAGGEALRRAATFDALADARGTSDWRTWTAALRDPSSDEVATFARERAHDVRFFAYLQWQADVQLARCAAVAPAPIGLYRDLAVGADSCGSDTWSLQDTLSGGATVGAPPDVINVRGQDWGVAPFDPLALRRAAYAPFVALLRANMRHAGALRIDHVMALARLYWVPSGLPATDGAYVTYRLDEMLAIVALESRRARCMVIGEDLGTVPAGFRERLAEKRLLSYRLLQFERDDAGFLAPDAYPALALVAIATHDLPPMGAYWTASDVATRAELGLLREPAAERRERDERAGARDQLLAAFDRALGLDEGRERAFRAAAERPDDRDTLAEIALFANRYLARSPGRLLMVQLEDVFGDVAQANVPTTTDEYPNWRRRAARNVDEIANDPRFRALADALRDRASDQAGSSSENVPSL